MDYVGRARSKMGMGERLLMIKPDHSILVHRKSGRDPVNWQPPGSIVQAEAHEDDVVIQCIRRSPREELKLKFRSASFFAALRLVDDAYFDMLLTEEELYSIILRNPELVEPGLRIVRLQKETKVGVIDLIARDGDGAYVVIEVKKNPANADAVKQLNRYVAELRGKTGSVRGVLAAPQINASSQRLLTSLGLEFRRLDLKKCAEHLVKEERSGTVSLDRHLREH